MESKIIHQQLRKADSQVSRHALICYLQYLMDYYRDVPTVEEYIVNELQGLSATAYARALRKDDPIYRILQLSQELRIEEENKTLWQKLRNQIAIL
jgi:hypothetical protein